MTIAKIMEGTSRKEMMIDIISKFGHEDRRTIQFCQYAEDLTISDKTIKDLYIGLIVYEI